MGWVESFVWKKVIASFAQKKKKKRKKRETWKGRSKGSSWGVTKRMYETTATEEEAAAVASLAAARIAVLDR